ncbi:4-coumarate--CoA ligase 1-like [Anneissia japonica]|uniref:4-coumarate--CoA ligase 1-like n=1 Tax=Anneissia japonica TaxID=1529436 RepID=UPI00142554A3|nr:4-coumarate--CoA ligase 1-like [Anneissia japonica]XP_033111418.1 4-coumarate--CoA ligase 1-like [Anneissia japonica]
MPYFSVSRCQSSSSEAGILRSPHPDVHIPEVPLLEYLMEKFPEYGDKIAVEDAVSKTQYAFSELRHVSERIASGLARIGFKKGDRFAVFSPNSAEYIAMFFGIVMAGGVVTTINPAYTSEELTFQLNNCEAEYIVTIPALLDTVSTAKKQAPFLKDVYVFGEAEGATSFSKLLNDDGSAFASISLDVFQDVCALPYSSGTTGLPKGVMLTHHNMVANQCQINRDLNTYTLPGSDIEANTLCLLPIFHIFGMTAVLMSSLYQGTRVVTIPRFEPELFLKTIQDYKITHMPVVPPVILFLAKHPLVDKYDLSSLQIVTCGAAPLGDELIAAVQKRLDIPCIRQGYGLTETSPVTNLPKPDNFIPASPGPLVPNTEAKVVDVSSGESLPVNKDGELWIRGPQVMKGYWKNEQATRECIDSDGFFHTGDIAQYNDQGHFFIVDRLKELIKVKGFQVAPAELEALCLTHPQIADVAVIGVPVEGVGELPKAYVVRKSEDLTEEQVKEFVGSQVAPYKKLKGGVEFVSEIPKSPSGKILRRVLRKSVLES